ncbi:hypothetical protein D9619_005943 [Psilocybe cf. subviscida]|uniref:Complex III subunit 7 n=1 Tax=Psilocybe cf. subviscida TaxID=2480587 RepID=A0A8H5BY39_9AGAR|nr:hypothetical protein D9619_005943 [Psilocybe cf. subviscida]
MIFGPLGASAAPYIRSSRTLSAWLQPLANWYANAAGYRKYGFKYDDLLVEEKDSVQRVRITLSLAAIAGLIVVVPLTLVLLLQALTRLTPGEQYDRAFRLKRASQASVLHAPLPKDQWTPASEDVRYLLPHVEEVMKEETERKKWDSMVVERKK